MRQVVRTLFLFAGQRRSLTRVFIQRSGIDDEFHARYARTWGEVSRKLRPALLARRHEIAHPDPEHAADFALQLIHSGWANDVLHHRVTAITGQESGDVLIEDLTSACLSWLGVRTRLPRPAPAL